MTLASIIKQHKHELLEEYGDRITPAMRRLIDAVLLCRTERAGKSLWHCDHCNTVERFPLSCGHRSCPMCQQRDTSQWIEREQQKLLPVDYFMLTVTLPFELRPLVWHNQKKVYAAMFTIASQLVKDFARTSPKLGADPGFIIILHTHTRRLDFHPHLHIVIPGGGYNKSKKQWIKNKGTFLFNEKAVASVWRARMLDYLNSAGFSLPRLPKKWIVNCRKVGNGLPALKYLSRYLYRGVLQDQNIIGEKEGEIIFQYRKNTGKLCTRSLPVLDFIWLVLQHVLPKRFRRLRCYGFLHGGGKLLLKRIQLLLLVVVPELEKAERPDVLCPHCQYAMTFLLILRRR